MGSTFTKKKIHLRSFALLPSSPQTVRTHARTHAQVLRVHLRCSVRLWHPPPARPHEVIRCPVARGPPPESCVSSRPDWNHSILPLDLYSCSSRSQDLYCLNARIRPLHIASHDRLRPIVHRQPCPRYRAGPIRDCIPIL